MNYFKFRYCILGNKHKFEKYIKKSKLFIDDKTSIEIKLDNDSILIDIDDFHKFIKFVIENKLACYGSGDEHGCYRYTYFYEYLDFIFKNNMIDHIKSPIIKKYLEFTKKYDNNFHLDYKYSDIIDKACKYSTLNTIKITMKLTNTRHFGKLFDIVLKRDDHGALEIFKYLVDLYCERLVNYFEYTIKECDYYKINYNTVLHIIANTDNLQAYNYYVENIYDTINSIDVTKIKPRRLNIYNKFLQSHDYSQKIKNNLLLECISRENLTIAEQLLKDGADINKFNKNRINNLFEDGKAESVDFIIDKDVLDGDQINDRFRTSYRYGWRVAEVLVSNGAPLFFRARKNKEDYELYIDKLMKKTKKFIDREFYYYLKELKKR
ncbi:hypothetical protein QLL95_gp0465 [Cotonvirus japonicus]|uniref:Ankyrin repeat protein n=1 Tax=Cotonvirus japonicus TaxID=2811091 RepID=A0ABM7NU00_9VIRU|nr:hypothetical protein QLL95_gp0465 [Cotonvirus japonicus]BCS83658.1 hypothetical protein [Cotonvirus japonicus]